MAGETPQKKDQEGQEKSFEDPEDRSPDRMTYNCLFKGKLLSSLDSYSLKHLLVLGRLGREEGSYPRTFMTLTH